LVFVGGEERGSDGAKAANRIASKSRFLINGEPTDLRLGAATRGAFRVRLTATGKAAHSGYPELGESAIEKLLDCLVALRSADWPADPLLGTTHLHHRLDQRRRRAECDSAERGGPKCSSAPSVNTRRCARCCGRRWRNASR
jgi:acetylornithine deacetylase/succinyl-diaminopimelate desuccinylase-like protein